MPSGLKPRPTDNARGLKSEIRRRRTAGAQGVLAWLAGWTFGRSGIWIQSLYSFYACGMSSLRSLNATASWFVGWSPEIPGANGQGKTVDECREGFECGHSIDFGRPAVRMGCAGYPPRPFGKRSLFREKGVSAAPSSFSWVLSETRGVARILCGATRKLDRWKRFPVTQRLLICWLEKSVEGYRSLRLADRIQFKGKKETPLRVGSGVFVFALIAKATCGGWRSWRRWVRGARFWRGAALQEAAPGRRFHHSG